MTAIYRGPLGDVNSSLDFRGDKFTPAGMTVTGFWIPASAGMTEKKGNDG